ncbi:InlB B-repeat-containing protein [Leucobacter komagatae]|uniref:InlB B-repeat-containing protein n=1 Tax=Leucobacter komagatae TaxID=55969 RepID=UPI0018DD7825|nr:InlB B-repeat-containing protein [Leucobacter komagatae]
MSTTQGEAELEGNTVTVTGLAVGAKAEVQVTASKAGHFDGSATRQGSAGFEPVHPVLSSPVSTADGFTVKITNFDPELSYGLEASSPFPGTPTAELVGDTVTVAGIPPAGLASVTVTASRPGWKPGTTTASAYALRAPSSIPELLVTRTSPDGFIAQITNYDAWASYRVEQPEAGMASLSVNTLRVSGLAPNREVTVRVFSARNGEAEGVTHFTASSAKKPAVRFEISDVVATAGGWTARISDYESLAHENTEFTAVTDNGEVSISEGVVTVTGLAPNQASMVTVTLSRTDTEPSTAKAEGRALQEYTVTFDARPGSPATPTATVTHGNPVPVPATPSRDRYAFTGWFADPEAQIPYDMTGEVTSDMTLYAGWKVTAYEVTWNPNRDGAGAVETRPNNGTTLGKLPVPSASGAVIREWNTAADGSGTRVSASTLLSSIASDAEVTVYAMWEKRTLSLTPSSNSPASGDTIDVRAAANAPFGGTVDVTNEMTLESSDPGDVVKGSTVLVGAAGARTLTGAFDGATASVLVNVGAGPIAELSVAPSALTVARGGTLEFTVTGVDAAQNPVEIDAADVMLTSDVETDIVDGMTVRFPTASPHVITARVGDVSASVKIEVQGDDESRPVLPSDPAVPSGSTPVSPGTHTGTGGLAGTGGVPLSAPSVAAVTLLVLGVLLLLERRRNKRAVQSV